MEKELDSSIIKATQLSLGKYVKRPPLSDKLLKKPPFRFLHDIVTSVLKSTGFFDGLFEDYELISDNVKDREAKIAFLNKVLYVISKTVGKELNVKPSKIVAGQEPEKTNELLQCLAEALDKNLTSKDAIISLRESTEEKKNVSKKKKILAKSKERNDIHSTASNKQIKLKQNVKQKSDTSKNISPLVKTDIKESKVKNIKVLHENPKKNCDDTVTSTENNYNINSLNETLPIPETGRNEILNKVGDITASNDVNESVNIEHIENKESDKNHETTELNQGDENGVHKSTKSDVVILEAMEREKISGHSFVETSGNGDNSESYTQNEPEKYRNNDISHSNINLEKSSSSNRPSSVRPSSSRPGAPKVRDKQDYRVLPNAENIAIGKVNIISENELLEEDEDSTMVIEHYSEDIVSQHVHDYNALNQHGHLVQQILDAQKEFTQANKTEIDWAAGSQNTRNEFSKEIEQLRFNVQAVSRVANPLGKIIDHIQEDVEVMRQELSQWLQIYNETTKKLLKQKALNEEIIVPLRIKTKQLDMDISEKYKKIDNLKILVYKNNTKIEKLLANEYVQ